jgi:hypothetical protein
MELRLSEQLLVLALNEKRGTIAPFTRIDYPGKVATG